jgi:hypothetical protein
MIRLVGITLASAAAHQTKCGRTGGVRQHGDRLPHTASRCQQQRSVSVPLAGARQRLQSSNGGGFGGAQRMPQVPILL